MIQVDIDQEGGVTVKVEGVAGKSCKELTADIEKALGKVVSDEKTAEFHQQAKQQGKQFG